MTKYVCTQYNELDYMTEDYIHFPAAGTPSPGMGREKEALNVTKLLIASFAVMILLVVLGIIFANKTIGWILYALGACLEVLFISGLRTQQVFFGETDWKLPIACRIVFYLILFAGGAAMVFRRSRAIKEENAKQG